MKFFLWSSLISYIKYTPSAFIGSSVHLIWKGFDLLSPVGPIHIPSVLVQLIIKPETLVKKPSKLKVL